MLAGDLDVSFGKVSCPSRSVEISVTNTGEQDRSYVLRVAGKVRRQEVIPSGSELTSRVVLPEDRSTLITVRTSGQLAGEARRKANCRGSGARTLPVTGERSALGLTGAATALTGGILVWYGLLWPRRRAALFP